MPTVKTVEYGVPFAVNLVNPALQWQGVSVLNPPGGRCEATCTFSRTHLHLSVTQHTSGGNVAAGIAVSVALNLVGIPIIAIPKGASSQTTTYTFPWDQIEWAKWDPANQRAIAVCGIRQEDNRPWLVSLTSTRAEWLVQNLAAFVPVEGYVAVPGQALAVEAGVDEALVHIRERLSKLSSTNRLNDCRPILSAAGANVGLIDAEQVAGYVWHLYNHDEDIRKNMVVRALDPFAVQLVNELSGLERRCAGHLIRKLVGRLQRRMKKTSMAVAGVTAALMAVVVLLSIVLGLGWRDETIGTVSVLCGSTTLLVALPLQIWLANLLFRMWWAGKKKKVADGLLARTQTWGAPAYEPHETPSGGAYGVMGTAVSLGVIALLGAFVAAAALNATEVEHTAYGLFLCMLPSALVFGGVLAGVAGLTWYLGRAEQGHEDVS
jgi:hypothetical protein